VLLLAAVLQPVQVSQLIIKDSDVFDQIESKGTTYTSKDPALGTSQITTSGTGTPYCFYRTQGIRDDGKKSVFNGWRHERLQ